MITQSFKGTEGWYGVPFSVRSLQLKTAIEVPAMPSRAKANGRGGLAAGSGDAQVLR